MSKASLEVPEGLLDPLRETVVLLYQATAEALHLSLRAHTQREGDLEEVQEHRARLADLDALLERLGWGREREAALAGAGGDLEVTAPRDILHDALYGALIDAGERLAVACDNAWRGEDTLDTVRAAATEVIGLDRLLGQLEG
jgi:hypothetical protein